MTVGGSKHARSLGSVAGRRAAFLGFLFLLPFAVAVPSFCGSPPAVGDDPGLSAHLPPSILLGHPFDFVVELQWRGEPDDWVVKTMDGPDTDGFREVGHSVSTVVSGGRGPGARLSGQVHRIRLLPEREGRTTIGPVSFCLLGRDGLERRLCTKSFRPVVTASLLDVFLARPWLIVAAAWSLVFAVVLFFVLNRRRKRRKEKEQALKLRREEETGEVDRLLGSVDRMKSLARDGEAKALYATAVGVIRDVLARMGQDCPSTEPDVLAAALDKAGLSTGLKKGLLKVVEEHRLVKFAGLRPDREELLQVCSRIEDLVRPLSQDGDGDD